MVRDSKGDFVGGMRSEVQLNLKEATFLRLAKEGLTAAMPIKAPAGSYSVRAVAVDAIKDKLATASGGVEVK